jgi:hypothetical protein
MSNEEIRLACLRLAIPDNVVFPDLKRSLEYAEAYVRFVEDTGSAALLKTIADNQASVPQSPDTAKAPGRTRRQKQTA